MRRVWQVLTLAAVAATTSGCLTQQLWSAGFAQEPEASRAATSAPAQPLSIVQAVEDADGVLYVEAAFSNGSTERFAWLPLHHQDPFTTARADDLPEVAPWEGPLPLGRLVPLALVGDAPRSGCLRLGPEGTLELADGGRFWPAARFPSSRAEPLELARSEDPALDVLTGIGVVTATPFAFVVDLAAGTAVLATSPVWLPVMLVTDTDAAPTSAPEDPR